MDWLDHTSDDEKMAILASVSHSLDYFDFDLEDSQINAGDDLLTSLDLAMNGTEVEGLALLVDDDTLQTLWATLFAFIRDFHAPQFNLKEVHWNIAENIFDSLNASLAKTPAVGV